MRALRYVVVVVLSIMMVSGMVPRSATAQESTADLENQLAQKYSPIAYLKTQKKQCGTPPYEGEPYLPLPVDMVLNNDRILVRDARTDAVLATGPSAQELATFGADTYLDFPGDPRRPGCTYETDERAWIADQNLEPTAYAHIVIDHENDKLALQYWFYYYFNDWNNTHESDFEGILLLWDDVDSVAEALNTDPTTIGYSQHGNGELASWGDNKVALEDGTHPAVYPAAGSHATFFTDDTFLAWGERNSGFGCDVSSPPSTRVPLSVILIPDEIDPKGDFAWLLYEGRWGERQPGSFNGPRGPYFNGRYADPWVSEETWRPFSIVVPDSTTVGPSMSQAFCTVTAAGSNLYVNAIIRPWVIIPAVLGAIALFTYFFRRSMPTFRRSVSIYRRNWQLFLGIGLFSIPIGIGFNLLQRFMIAHQPVKWLVDWLDDTGGARLTAVLMIGGVQQLAMVLLIAPAIVFALEAVLERRPITILDAYRRSSTILVPILLALLALMVVVFPLLLIAIGFPLAILIAVRWHFFMQALVFDHTRKPVDSLKMSASVVKGRWWTTAFSLAVFDLMAVAPGILIGFGLLTIGRTAVGFANSISSLLYAVLIPLSVISVSVLYLERRQQSGEYPGITISEMDDIVYGPEEPVTDESTVGHPAGA